MIIHPELRALRSDDAPQRAAQAALLRAEAAWRKRPEVAAALAGFERFAAGRPLAECSALAALFDAGDAGREFAFVLIAAMLEALRAAPLGHVPLRHFTDGLTSTLLLARSGRATLALVATDGASLRGRPAPTTADFSPAEMWDHVLAGTGAGELIERHPDERAPARSAVMLAPGAVLSRDSARQALQVRAVEGCLVTLRLQRRHAGAGPMREYRLDDGRLVHQAAGDPRDSRIELMMALLGRMGRRDAAPLLAAIAREDGSTALRWQALRECLALDTAAGFHALCEIARAGDDLLAAPAEALRARLVESHPSLTGLDACPA